jgi:hypothetical protein
MTCAIFVCRNFKYCYIMLQCCGSRFIESGSGYRSLMTKFFFIKNYNLISLGLHKRCPSYMNCLLPSKENIQHFKKWYSWAYSLSNLTVIHIVIAICSHSVHWFDWFLLRTLTFCYKLALMYINFLKKGPKCYMLWTSNLLSHKVKNPVFRWTSCLTMLESHQCPTCIIHKIT